MRVLSLVKNNFINDSRVHKTVESYNKFGSKSLLIAEKSFKGIPVFELKKYLLIRVPVFSSLYSSLNNNGKATFSNKQISLLSKIKTIIRNNKMRMYIVSFLNSFGFNLISLFIGIIYQPKIIHANDLNTLLVGFLISKITRAKLIYDSHEIWLHGVQFQISSKVKRKFWRILEKRIISKADIVITTTDYRAEYLKKMYKLDKVVVIKNCPEYKKITNKNLFRNEFDISKQDKIILYQGGISKIRGVFDMVNIIRKIENVKLIFMGNGSIKSELINYVNKNNLEKKIFFKNAVPMEELLDYTASADIGLQLLKNTGINHYSTISNKVFEYLMAEIPIIASNFPELRKIVFDNKIGLVTNPANHEETENTIRELVSNNDLYNQCKQNMCKIKKIYNWENEKLVLKKIYDALKD